MGKKIGRNDPCPCNSGKKYKKCHGDPTRKNFAKLGTRPAPPEMQEVVRRMHQMHEELKPLRLTSRPQIQTEFKGKKYRAVRSGVHIRPIEETFHEFLVNHLLWKFGKHWFDNEIKKGREDRHVVLQWRAELHEQVRAALNEKINSKGPIAVVPTGNAQALLVLADDVYQVEHALKTPRRIMERLRDHTQFQGARYEILAASIFARCGFTIDFINDKTKKCRNFSLPRSVRPRKLRSK